MGQRVGRGIALLFQTAALERGEWSTSRPGRNLAPGKTRYPLYRRLGGPQGRSARSENLAKQGFFLKHLLPSQLNTWLTKFFLFRFSLYYMCCVLIHHVILCLHFAVFPSRGVVGVTHSSFLTSSWVAMSVPCGSCLGGGVLSRVSTDNSHLLCPAGLHGMTSILLGA